MEQNVDPAHMGENGCLSIREYSPQTFCCCTKLRRMWRVSTYEHRIVAAEAARFEGGTMFGKNFRLMFLAIVLGAGLSSLAWGQVADHNISGTELRNFDGFLDSHPSIQRDLNQNPGRFVRDDRRWDRREDWRDRDRDRDRDREHWSNGWRDGDHDRDDRRRDRDRDDRRRDHDHDRDRHHDRD
jgi:hypothetical protein